MKRSLKPRTTPVEFELEGSLGPLKARIKGLLTQSALTPNQKIAARFVSLAVNHGILPEQIPRLFTGIGYSDLATLETLADILSPVILDACASMFGVNVKWIESGEGEIYALRWCYQSPKFFQEHIVELGSRLADYPVRFLVDSDLKAGGKSPCTPQVPLKYPPSTPQVPLKYPLM